MKINYILGRYNLVGNCDRVSAADFVLQYGTEEDAKKAAQGMSELYGENFRVFQLVDLGTGEQT